MSTISAPGSRIDRRVAEDRQCDRRLLEFALAGILQHFRLADAAQPMQLLDGRLRCGEIR
jgi:hypothetical protein